MKFFPRPTRAEQQLSYEVSDEYFTDNDSPYRASSLLKSAKILVVLEDPVKRAFSHYQVGISGQTDRGQSLICLQQRYSSYSDRRMSRSSCNEGVSFSVSLLTLLTVSKLILKGYIPNTSYFFIQNILVLNHTLAPPLVTCLLAGAHF